MMYSVVGNEDGSKNITVFVSGKSALVAHSTHPNFEKILAGVLAEDESVADLFDLALTASTKFERLSERVTAANGRLYFDGEEVENALAKQVLRFITEDVEDWKPLVNFFENVQTNPEPHSREQLYDWLNAHDFTITPDGMIVGYKGVQSSDGVNFLSLRAGKATVNGEVKTGQIPQKVGDVVEMPRGEVAHDPSEPCHSGLHVGTYDFARGYNQGAMLEVHVNPRDVVSVPTDASGEKVRVCRYIVVQTLDAPRTEAVVSDYYEDDDEYYENTDDFCDDCGDELTPHGECATCAAIDANDGEPLDERGWGLEDDPKVQGGQQFSGKYMLAGPTVSRKDDTAPKAIQTMEYGVSVGARYKDLDTRRPRTLEVVGFGEDVANNEVVVKNLATGKLSSINAHRLLTAYRFTKV